MSSTSKYNKNLVIVIASIAATGGLLFGFDTGVISGAIPFLQDYHSPGSHRGSSRSPSHRPHYRLPRA